MCVNRPLCLSTTYTETAATVARLCQSTEAAAATAARTYIGETQRAEAVAATVVRRQRRHNASAEEHRDCGSFVLPAYRVCSRLDASYSPFPSSLFPNVRSLARSLALPSIENPKCEQIVTTTASFRTHNWQPSPSCLTGNVIWCRPITYKNWV